MIFRVGEPTGAQYKQGSNHFGEVFKDMRAAASLARGCACVISSLNVNRGHANDVLAAETLLRVKQHLAKRYGRPRWTAGRGGSGGASQQLRVADTCPRLPDDALAEAAFSAVRGPAPSVTGCRLPNRDFISHPGASAAQRQAFEGFTRNTRAAWDAGNGVVIVATGGAGNAGGGLNNKALVYHPTSNPNRNPTGARCMVQDISANILGRDAATGFARRPQDHVDVQNGLAALQKDTVTLAQFLDVNEGVGGYDIDGNLISQRTATDAATLRSAYTTGRFRSGGGGLSTPPILHLRAYAGPGADIHTLYNDPLIREKLKRADGRSDNQVIWVLPNPALAPLLGLGAAQQAVLTQLVDQVVLQELDRMTQRRDGLTGGAGVCSAQYKKSPSPRVAAGGPRDDDLMKCPLKPVHGADYAPAVPTAADLSRPATLVPMGVCGHSKPGAEQVPFKGTWLSD